MKIVFKNGAPLHCTSYMIPTGTAMYGTCTQSNTLIVQSGLPSVKSSWQISCNICSLARSQLSDIAFTNPSIFFNHPIQFLYNLMTVKDKDNSN